MRYYARLPDLPVLSRSRPGDVFNALPDSAPEAPEPFENVLADLDQIVAAFVDSACRALRLGRGDLVAAYFCSVKKTLAMGVPLASSFARNAEEKAILELYFSHTGFGRP